MYMATIRHGVTFQQNIILHAIVALGETDSQILGWFLTGQGIVKHSDNSVCAYNRDNRRVWCDRDRERKRGGGKEKDGVNLVCFNADLFLEHFGAGRYIYIATGWWEFVGGGREVTARRGDKSAWILQLFVVL